MTANLTRYPEERRLATIMFADIEGFTALAEQLDIEEVSDLIREIWQRVDGIIEKYDGYIDKHIGDAVMAVWGAPQAREDDAERAVNAALEMLTDLRDYAAHSERPVVQQLRMRVGLNTGSVLAGYVGARGEYTVIGDAVNIASRLETNADPGTVIVGENTVQLIRGLFKLHQLEPLVVKGKADPIAAFKVGEKLDQPNRLRYRAAKSLETHLVARDEELARLREIYSESRHSPTPLLVFVRGEAGLGKSRLLMEFTNHLETEEQPPVLFSARGLKQASRTPYFIWKALWYSRFGCSDTDPAAKTRDNFLHGLQSLWGPQVGLDSPTETAHLLGNLIGIPWDQSPFIKSFGEDADARTFRAFELTRDLFRRSSAAGPLILALDDLQWAGAGSLNLLLHLVTSPTSSRPLPMLIICGVRPGLLRHNPRLEKLGETINLSRLPISANMVAKAYPALSEISEKTLLALAKRADGNPYYLEEMVKSLVGARNSPAVEADFATALNGHLPESLHAILQARLDALSPEARWIALLASVVGRTFWVGALLAEARQASMTGLLDFEQDQLANRVTQGLAELVRAELAFPRVGSLFSGEAEYIFKHSLVQEVAYELLPHKYRRQYHMAVAQWLATHSGLDFMATIAAHLEKGGAIQEAGKQYQQAAHYALTHGASEDAHWMHTHAHELLTQAN